VTGNEETGVSRRILLNLACVVFVSGCVMAPQRTGKWTGYVSERKLPCNDGHQVPALELTIVDDSLDMATANPNDSFVLIYSGMGYHAPILVDRRGIILPVDAVPTNSLIWIIGELGVRRRVKLPDQSEATFDGHSDIVRVSLYMKKWGVCDCEASPQYHLEECLNH
jgi:hypothetical protein